jgi:hypothetical protein
VFATSGIVGAAKYEIQADEILLHPTPIFSRAI